MCASDSYCSTTNKAPQDRAQVAARLRTLLDAAGVLEHRLVTDDELYQVWFTARWLTLADGRNPNDQDELARTLRLLRFNCDQAGAA